MLNDAPAESLVWQSEHFLISTKEYPNSINFCYLNSQLPKTIANTCAFRPGFTRTGWSGAFPVLFPPRPDPDLSPPCSSWLPGDAVLEKDPSLFCRQTVPYSSSSDLYNLSGSTQWELATRKNPTRLKPCSKTTPSRTPACQGLNRTPQVAKKQTRGGYNSLDSGE